MLYLFLCSDHDEIQITDIRGTDDESDQARGAGRTDSDDGEEEDEEKKACYQLFATHHSIFSENESRESEGRGVKLTSFLQ